MLIKQIFVEKTLQTVELDDYCKELVREPYPMTVRWYFKFMFVQIVY